MTFPEKAYSIPVIYFNFFKKLVINYDPKYKISLKEYRKIIYLFNKKLVQKLLEGKVVDLPYELGEIRIKKKSLNIEVAKLNIQHYVKTGEKTRHYNEHSDGFRAMFYWRKELCNVPGSYAFSFTPTETNKRNLAKVMKTKGEHKRYFQ